MQEVYRPFYSRTLGHDVEMLVFGDMGYPIVLFPTSRGRYYEAKDFKLTESARWFVENHKVKLYCIDSVDTHTWYAKHLRPTAGQYNAYYDTYISLVPEGTDPLAQLQHQPEQLRQLVGHLTDEQAQFAYAPGKWSIKEVLVHILDTERIFAYRALRIARHDQQPLAGFEQDDYVPASGANARALESILNEYATVRAATLSLFDSFQPEAYDRMGTASGHPVSVRALAFMLPGHEAHHLHILQSRYLPNLPA